MKTRPILFSGEMVQAILAGTKTQTRRLVKARGFGPYDGDEDEDGWPLAPANVSGCLARLPAKYGQRGDKLWVRETWRPVMEMWTCYIEYAAGGTQDVISRDLLAPLKKVALRFPGARKDRHSEDMHPSIHMPRWASRLCLDVASVHVERLQELTKEKDALAEGVSGERSGSYGFDDRLLPPALANYRRLWDQINGAGSWESDPWVWVVEFKVPHG